jgi:hypothetical protein
LGAFFAHFAAFPNFLRVEAVKLIMNLVSIACSKKTREFSAPNSRVRFLTGAPFGLRIQSALAKLEPAFPANWKWRSCRQFLADGPSAICAKSRPSCFGVLLEIRVATGHL